MSILDPTAMAKGTKYADWPGLDHMTNPKALWDESHPVTLWLGCRKKWTMRVLLSQCHRTNVGRLKHRQATLVPMGRVSQDDEKRQQDRKELQSAARTDTWVRGFVPSFLMTFSGHIIRCHCDLPNGDFPRGRDSGWCWGAGHLMTAVTPGLKWHGF